MLLCEIKTDEDAKNMLTEFVSFLKTTTLNEEHKKYRSVEKDLNYNLNPTNLIDELFFMKKEWIDYPQFFNLYVNRHEELLRIHAKTVYPHLTKGEFLRGLEARLYRTQMPILTELQGYLRCKVVFGSKNVTRALNMDKSGVDFIIDRNDERYNMHVFSDTLRGRINRRKKALKAIENGTRQKGKHVDFAYELYVATKKNMCDILSNGFGIFSEDYVIYLKDEIDKGNVKNDNVLSVGTNGFIYGKFPEFTPSVKVAKINNVPSSYIFED